MTNAHTDPGLTPRNIRSYAANAIAAAELAAEGRADRAAKDPGSAKLADGSARATKALGEIRAEQADKCSRADVAAARARILRDRAADES